MATATSGPSGDLALDILAALSKTDTLSSSADFPNAQFSDLKAALDRLSSRSMISYKQIDQEIPFLEPEGELIAEHGSHEARVFEAVRQALDGLTIVDLDEKEKWISKGKDGKLVASVESIKDVTREQLKTIKTTHAYPDAKVLAELRKRKLVRLQKEISFSIEKGPKFALEIVKEETDLTDEMLANGSWKTAAFKPYNFDALGADQHTGALHPLMKVRQEFRNIFFELGFEEMATDRFVESGFWNFDALVVPQSHPARDLQDTFFISDPKQAAKPHAEDESDKKDYDTYWENVRAVHENGRFGSVGHRYNWQEEEALRLVLRTHTTSVSTAVLHKLAAKRGPDGRPPPARYFSIDRVFRNETVDATHLAEFHQCEGVIADYNLTLGGLMDFMTIFFEKMGIYDLRFKPAYNPYTEPSMEIFSFHKGLNKLVEIGNSGMFRPEMLESMGLPSDMRVYGWGLSLERPTMIKYKISNIRELLGHKVDLNFIEKNPAVRLDKD
ncbi:hypothetical protein NUW58_g101 [Xylaria curta]|uniref:Uncharacterized protein n=1 Tax=Xylaria curta TaxID=42375 RepID=A0ACC1PQF5_9PEZI|nr:hypothetical protein NUW58_g101 [Xylaria curta]